MTTRDLLERMAEAISGLLEIENARILTGAFKPNSEGMERIKTAKKALAAYDARGAQGEELVKFLCGEGPLDGVWFGESHPTDRGNYWWRKYVRARLPKEAE